MKLVRLLAQGVRLGASAPGVRQLAGKALGVAQETRDAFGRGLRGEPEPPAGPRASPDQVAAWYANLEVAEGAGLDQVHRAWKRLQRRYHPDLHAADLARAERATELIQQLNEAYQGLRAHLER